MSFMRNLKKAEGQHKGAMLLGLLRELDMTFDAIIFVDDVAKNVQQVEQVYGQCTSCLFIRYGKEDPRVAEFQSPNKDKLHQELMEILNVVSKPAFFLSR